MRSVRLMAVLALTVSAFAASTSVVLADAEQNLQVVEGLLADPTGERDIADTHHQDVMLRNPVGVFDIEQAAANAETIQAGIPDMQTDIQTIAAGDDWVVVHYTLSGTFLNDLPNPSDPTQMVPASGEPFSVDVHTAYIFDEDGLIIHEVQSYWWAPI